MVKSETVLSLRAMSGSVAMQHKGQVLKSVAHITTIDHRDITDLRSYLGPYRCPKVVQSYPCSSLAVVL